MLITLCIAVIALIVAFKVFKAIIRLVFIAAIIIALGVYFGFLQ